jgi:YD repeat-containing protein
MTCRLPKREEGKRAGECRNDPPASYDQWDEKDARQEERLERRRVDQCVGTGFLPVEPKPDAQDDSDGKGTQTFGYDSTSGLLTKLEDSAAGTFTAAYNADGAMTEEGLPDGLLAKTTYDETGAPSALSYTKTTNCTEKCTWLEESEERSIYGQVLSQKSLSASHQYSYDKAGRLTLAHETPTGGGCTTRAYAFEGEAGKDSNRTSLTTREPGVGGACAESGGTKQSYSYDAADRLTGEGVTYDNFGRITSLPVAYAGGSTLTTSFYSNEMIASQSQGGLTNSYQLDATGRVRQVTQTGLLIYLYLYMIAIWRRRQKNHKP